MTITYSPLRSTHGFKSPGFEVSPTGVLTINSGGTLTFEDTTYINSSLYVATQIFIDTDPVFEFGASTVGFSSDLTTSYLETLGTLQELNVQGDVTIEDSSNNLNISIVNGVLSIESFGSTGSIENVDIGQTSPGDGRFVDIVVDNDISIANDISATTIAVNSATITTTVGAATGNITTLNTTTGNITTVNATTVNTDDVTVDDITINNTPVQAYHATRKDYVDNRITALSIALGA